MSIWPRAPSEVRKNRASSSVVALNVPRRTGTSRRCASERAFVAEQFELLDAGADEAQARFRAIASERRALAQKTVARMNRVAVGLERGLDDRCAVEIGARPAPSQLHGVFRLANVQRLRVVLRVDRYGSGTELGGGPRDAHGDFAAIGDQQIHPCTSCARSVRVAMK
jgi:hypothetical protein